MANAIHYLKGVVAIDPDLIDDALSVLEEAPIPGQAAEEASRFTASAALDEDLIDILRVERPEDEEEAASFDRAFDLLKGMVGIIKTDDPEPVMRSLRSHGIIAARVHAMGFEGHAGYMPGTDPKAPDPPPPPLPPIGRPTDDRIVAIVDSGIVEDPALSDWLEDTDYDSLDVETLSASNLASHGTHVISIIRQIAPHVRISIARAPVVPLDPDKLELVPPGQHDDASPLPTTEYHVAFAIARLIDRHRDHSDKVAVLNLSLGAYTNDPTHMLAMRGALDSWRKVFTTPCIAKGPIEQGVSQIIAAGGNIPGSVPAYPGAFNDVRAVGATDCNDTRQYVWDRNAPNPDDRRVPASRRWWITDVAPGDKIHGLSGDGDEVVNWSGSSFATAIATAAFLTDGKVPFTYTDKLVWWGRADSVVDCGLIHGLRTG